MRLGVARDPAYAEGVRVRLVNTALVVSAVAAMTVAVASARVTRVPPLYKNCTHLNAKYHQGVGRFGAHDHTSGKPVTNFFRSNRLYAIAIKWNAGLDRDRDKIACESA